MPAVMSIDVENALRRIQQRGPGHWATLRAEIKAIFQRGYDRRVINEGCATVESMYWKLIEVTELGEAIDIVASELEFSS